jgi:hypothetical protein
MHCLLKTETRLPAELHAFRDCEDFGRELFVSPISQSEKGFLLLRGDA